VLFRSDEVIERRLGRLVREKAQLPHLVVIDGGVPQLNAAKAVLDRLALSGRVDLISISKDRTHRSKIIHLVDGKQHPVEWPLFALIQEEIHRFAIKFHRERSAKEMLKSTGRRPSP
jgi:excinuclease ABC subunit C